MSSNDILLYPSLNDNIISRLRLQKQPFFFFYTDKNDDEFELVADQIDATDIYAIKDEQGVWTQNDNNIGFRRRYCLRTFNCLFGENGVACADAVLGMAIQWMSPDSKQRGVVPFGTFTQNDSIFEAQVDKIFGKAQLRGEVCLSTILYIAEPGHPSDNESYLANTAGYVLGELDSCTIQLDGTSSIFPVYEIYEPDQPLWTLQCDWDDPTLDSLSECVSINLNKAHKNYPYINREDNRFDSQLLAEIMASAITLIINQVRFESGYWEQITQGKDLQQGSIGQAIFYFMKTLGWDVSTPINTSVSARRFFEQRIQ